MDIISKEHSEKMKLGKMPKEANIEELLTLPGSLQKSDVNRHDRDSEDNKTTLLGCKDLSIIEELTKKIVNNFNLFASKKKNGRKCKTPHKEEILKNGVLLIILSDEEAKDATSLNKEDKDEMRVVTYRDI